MAGSHFSMTSLASCAPVAASPIIAAEGVSSTTSRVASSVAFPLLGMPIQTRTLIQTMMGPVTSAAALDQPRRRSTTSGTMRASCAPRTRRPPAAPPAGCASSGAP